MSSYYIPILLLQIFCVVHVFRTGRNMIWIMLIMFLPGVGIAAYFIVEILPGLTGSRAAYSMGRTARQIVNPGASLRQAADDFAMADTVENRRNYAAASLAAGRADKAIELLEPALTGFNADDEGLLTDLAQAQFVAGNPARTLELLERVRSLQKKFKSAETQLLYARALEAVGRDQDAEAEYRELVTHYAGEEARCRYGLLLKKLGRADEARTLFEEIVQRQRRAPGYYRRAQREWVDIAKGQLG